jgi:ATP-binding cassette subfamily C protein CydD
LSAFSFLRKPLRAYQLGLAALSVLASMSLWYWFYITSYWLENWLYSVNAPYPLNNAIIAIILFLIFRLLHAQLRSGAGTKFSRIFYNKYLHQLTEKRWALIRSKPQAAWQDILFRHAPAIEQYILEFEVQKMLIGIMPIAVLIIITPISWMAALILFITLPLIPLFMWLVGMGAAKMHKRHIRVLNHLGQFFADRIAGQSTVRIFNQQQAQLERFEISSAELNKRLADVVKIAFLSSSVLDFFSTVSMALLAVFIGFSLLEEINIGFWQHGPSLGSGLFILLISPAFFAELKNLGRLYHVKAEATAGAESWQEVLTAEPTEQIQPLTENFNSLIIQRASVKGLISQTDDELLNLEQLTITAGDRILISGESGSGKTVLLDVIAGLRNLSAESIQLNGEPVKDLSQLKNHILYLNQRPDLMAGTVAENIGLGQFSDSEIIQAINTVGLTEWLNSQPDGIHTRLGDFPPLSGGQKQRFALTRLVLFNLPILLLDEPLAHISNDEQSGILKLMLQLTENKTSIWISHKPVPIENFNRQWHISSKGEVSCQ